MNDNFWHSLRFTLPISLIAWALFVLLVLAVGGCGGGTSTSAPQPTAATTPAYEQQGSGPIVILLASNMHDTLAGGVDYDIPQRLLAAGYSIVSLDLPCHGANAPLTNGDTDPLDCWAARVEVGDTAIFTDFCAGLSRVIDKLGAPTVSVVGVSRGAYVSITCAAYDARIRNLALIIPLIDLQRLSEFNGVAVDEEIFGLSQYVPAMRERHLLVRIGDDDTRVGTAPAVDFAQQTNAALQLLDTVGHSAPEDGSTIVWLNNQEY